MTPEQPCTAQSCSTLKAEIAMVTGAGSGIGLAYAEVLAENGAKVLFTGKTPERLETAVSGCASRLRCRLPGARHCRHRQAQDNRRRPCRKAWPARHHVRQCRRQPRPRFLGRSERRPERYRLRCLPQGYRGQPHLQPPDHRARGAAHAAEQERQYRRDLFGRRPDRRTARQLRLYCVQGGPAQRGAAGRDRIRDSTMCA